VTKTPHVWRKVSQRCCGRPQGVRLPQENKHRTVLHGLCVQEKGAVRTPDQEIDEVSR